MRSILTMVAVFVPATAWAFQPCPPGTAPSMIPAWIAGLGLAVGLGGFCWHRRARATERRARIRWTIAGAAGLLLSAVVGLGVAIYQGAVGTCS